ncbi:lipopolysaccharide assembly protein LapA domain-containing protein [Pseudomonas wadenswilerensis]
MAKVLKLLIVIVVFLMALGVLFFVLENEQVVTLVFLGWVWPALPVSVLILAAATLGLLLGGCAGWLGGRKRIRKVS